MIDYSVISCPACKGGLLRERGFFWCGRCKTRYKVEDGIPVMLRDLTSADSEQDLAQEKEFYENMFSGVKGFEDGHCIVYGHEKIYRFMEDVPRGSLLEVGCGGGHHSVNLSRMGFGVTSIDISMNALRAARKLSVHEGQDVLFVCGDIKRLPFRDNEFDICFCSLILHHFTALDNIIRELARVTRGHLLAFEVNALDVMSFVRFNLINPAFGIRNISKNQRALFPGRLERLLSQNGFGLLKLKYEDMHEYLGKAPRGARAGMVRTYQNVMKLIPARYSSNKFLLLARRRDA